MTAGPPVVPAAAPVAAAPVAAAPASVAAPAPTPRLESIDFMRGLVMVIMALDHVRDHLSDAHFEPTDLAKTSAALFFTRWITHFCAPAFVFLAGAGTFFWGARPGRTKPELSRWLLTRGLWLVFLEMTFITVEWEFGWNPHYLTPKVIWALGWSMVALAALVRLPVPAIGAFGWWMILLHDLFDRVKPESLGPFAGLWMVLHQQGEVQWAPGFTIFVMYPLVPWIGVMAAGYAFGSWFAGSGAKTRRRTIALGALLVCVFAELRLYNFYGDPLPWSHQKSALFTALSFLDTSKYPPSLLFLFMTLGPALILLGVIHDRVPRWLRPVVVFGRVPFFYYLLHLALIDLMCAGFALARYGAHTREAMTRGFPPPDWGWSLPVVYAAWIGLVVALYPACRWYAGVKARSRSKLLGYL